MRINRKLIKNKSYTIPYENLLSCVFQQRLGNNLFQLGICLTLAEKHKYKCVFDNWRYSSCFDFNLIFSTKEKSNYKWKIYSEPEFKYNPILIDHNCFCLKGWFQSYKYLDKDLILNTFKFKKNIIQYILSKYSFISKNKCTSIHIRRGDYVNHPDYHNLDYHYYNNAISLLKNDTDYFVVFSDDINWCKNNYNLSNMIFIEKEMEYIDLIMMSMCDNNIIANSTFSWWGAYLNNKKDKKVICPDSLSWFKNNLNAQDICPPEWIHLDFTGK